MFSCTTKFSCDICGTGYFSQRSRMTDCMSRDRFREVHKKEGWRVVYGKWDVCSKCVQHYGIRYIRKMLKEREQK